MNVEPSPGTDSHVDAAATLLHDAVHRGQAEPRALSALLRREERLEQPLADLAARCRCPCR